MYVHNINVNAIQGTSTYNIKFTLFHLLSCPSHSSCQLHITSEFHKKVPILTFSSQTQHAIDCSTWFNLILQMFNWTEILWVDRSWINCHAMEPFLDRCFHVSWCVNTEDKRVSMHLTVHWVLWYWTIIYHMSKIWYVIVQQPDEWKDWYLCSCAFSSKSECVSSVWNSGNQVSSVISFTEWMCFFTLYFYR